MRGVEHWAELRQRPIDREAQAVFCGYMYALWADDQVVMDYLNTGAVDGYTWDCFKKARAKFYQKGLDEV